MLKIIILTTALSLFGAGMAQAGEFTPAVRGSYMLDLDTADGNFSQWQMTDLSGLNAARAHVTFARKGKHKTYAALATISLESQDRRGYIRFVALSANGPLYTVVTLEDSKGEISSEMVLLPPDIEEPFDVHIGWSPEGKIVFDLYDKANKDVEQGFEHHEIDMGQPVTAMKIVNSTGEVILDPLQLGQEKP